MAKLDFKVAHGGFGHVSGHDYELPLGTSTFGPQGFEVKKQMPWQIVTSPSQARSCQAAGFVFMPAGVLSQGQRKELC